MAERDYDSKIDEIERDNLQKAIAEVETALASGKPGTQPTFQTFLQNAKNRVGALDKKIKDAERERETHSREQVVFVQMAAESEKALSAQEQKTFGGFLAKEFFTKNDFGALEQFYAKTRDRLSESGKDEMSQRIWGGIRRNEYTFGELPKSVREKETEHAYKRLNGAAIEMGSAAGIPEKDRRDFNRAYESGDREGAGKILERDSFKEHMFRGRESAARSHSAVDRGNEAERASALARLDANTAEGKPSKKLEATNGTDRDLSAFDLDGVKLVDAHSQGTSADIPSGKTNAAPQRGSTRGG
jgi:hypothetical protein